jgi:hypothetical protein
MPTCEAKCTERIGNAGKPQNKYRPMPILPSNQSTNPTPAQKPWYHLVHDTYIGRSRSHPHSHQSPNLAHNTLHLFEFLVQMFLNPLSN